MPPPAAAPPAPAQPRQAEGAISTLRLLLPLGLFLAGFCLLVILHLLFSQVLIARLDRQTDNAHRLLQLAEVVAQESLRIEGAWYRMVVTSGLQEQQQIREEIGQRLGMIRTALRVMQHGGTLRWSSLLLDHGDNAFHAIPFALDERLAIGSSVVSALTAVTSEIEDQLVELSNRLSQREQYRERSDRTGIFLTEGSLKTFLKQASSPLMERMHQSTDSMTRETRKAISALRENFDGTRRMYFRIEGLLACAIITLISLLALRLARQHGRSTRQLAWAKEELNEAHRLAQEASRLKSDFLANMSHEIRTPMNAIIGLSSILLEGQPDATQARHIRTIKQSAETLLRLLNDILDFSKIEAGQLEIEYQPFRLSQVMEDVLKIFADTSRRKGVDLFSRTDPQLPDALIGDALRLQQILTNLISNAFKFTREGEIVVEASSSGDNHGQILLQLSVRDSGIGIPADKLETIFGQFHQADASVARLYGGTGLGLSICRRLCQLMGGDIRVESREGHGSTFLCTILCQRDASDANSSAALDASLCHHPVLIVHARKTARIILREALSSWGLPVLCADDAATAVTLLQNWPREEGKRPKVAILDKELAIRSSTNLLAAAQQLDSSGLKVILLVSTGDEIQLQALHNTRQLVLVPKPFLLSEIRSQLQTLLRSQGQAGAATAEAVPRLLTPRGIRILLAEDNSINAEIARHILEHNGLQVDWAETGWDALRLLAKARYDAILMDVQMPELDGHATTALIRACENGRVEELASSFGARPDEALLHSLAQKLGGSHIPVLALTAHATVEDRQRCLQAGMDDYLTKPFKSEEMLAAIENVLALSAKDSTGENTEPRTFATQETGTPEQRTSGERMERIKSHLRTAFNLPDDKIAAMLPTFITTLQGHMKNLETLQQSGDLIALGKAGHTIKGALLNLGLKEMADIAFTIERQGKEQAKDTDFAALVAQLRRDLDEIR